MTAITSREARIKIAPHRNGRIVTIVAALATYPGLTASEIAEVTGYGPVEVRRRLTDAKNKGLAFQGEARKSRCNVNRELTWFPVERQAVLPL